MKIYLFKYILSTILFINSIARQIIIPEEGYYHIHLKNNKNDIKPNCLIINNNKYKESTFINNLDIILYFKKNSYDIKDCNNNNLVLLYTKINNTKLNLLHNIQNKFIKNNAKTILYNYSIFKNINKVKIIGNLFIKNKKSIYFYLNLNNKNLKYIKSNHFNLNDNINVNVTNKNIITIGIYNPMNYNICDCNPNLNSKYVYINEYSNKINIIEYMYYLAILFLLIAYILNRNSRLN